MFEQPETPTPIRVAILVFLGVVVAGALYALFEIVKAYARQ
jgi:hypothetical protein